MKFTPAQETQIFVNAATPDEHYADGIQWLDRAKDREEGGCPSDEVQSAALIAVAHLLASSTHPRKDR